MTPMVLAADIGSSSLKAAMIDFDGRLSVFGRLAYMPGGNVTVLAEDWEDAFFTVVNGLRKELRGRGESFSPAAICISGNGPTLVPLDYKGNALSPLHWHDGKSITPHEGCLSFFLPRAAWLKENFVSQYEGTKCFISSHEWLCARLGAEPVTSLPSAAYEKYYWDKEQCGVYGVDCGKFPPTVKMGRVIGKLSAAAAARLGIEPGIPIVSGAPDFIAALIGSGTIEAGSVCDRAGTSEGINLCVSSRVKAEGLRALPHAKEGLWNLGAVIPFSGRLFEWFRRLTGQKNSAYEELLKELIPKPSPESFFDNSTIEAAPALFPPGSSARVSGIGNGLIISAPSLPGRLELGRAVLEAMGFSVRKALEKFEGIGFPVKEMVVSGGQGKNPRWNQLKSDITGTVLRIPEITDAELAGNAILCALALGKVSSVEEGSIRMIRIKESFSPHEKNAAFWEERFRLYGEKFESLLPKNVEAESVQ